MKAFLLAFKATIIGIAVFAKTFRYRANFSRGVVLFVFLLLSFSTFSQTPTSFQYQAVLRDASGGILANQQVEIGVALLQGSAAGNEVFSETHSVTTNDFGLVNLQIGSVNTADMETIDWSKGPYFIEISVDGTVMGTSQLLSVPYALHAKTVENDKVEDADTDPGNELQILSISNDTIYLSNGGKVKLPPETDPAFTYWDKSSGISITESQISDLDHFTGDDISGNETAFDGWDKDASDDFTTTDETDPVFSSSLAAAITAADTARWASNNYTQNELQNLKLENQQLSISGGNTIDLSEAYYIADSSATNELQDITLNGTQLSITKGSTVDLSEVQDGDKQRLSLGVTNQHEIRLNISNANFVEMPFVKDGVSKYNWSEAENYVARWGQYGAMQKSTIYDNGNIGIGTEKPSAKLEVAGQVKITGGSPGSGKILTSNSEGLASWENNLDNDPTNELQVISISNDTIYLSDGGKIKLPAETDPTFTSSQAANIDATDITNLDNLSGVNTGDQDISGIAINEQAIQDTASQIRADIPTVTTYSVGDFAQGGIVFWVDETGQHGLVAAKEDQSTEVRWYAGTYGNTQAKGDGPFAGEANTSIIIAAQVAIGDDGSTYAARICNELQITEGGKTYGDWYLPSKEELNLMYQNKAVIDATAGANGGSGFAYAPYWSSTEKSNGFAWLQYFDKGSQYYSEKDITIRVRAVRAF